MSEGEKMAFSHNSHGQGQGVKGFGGGRGDSQSKRKPNQNFEQMSETEKQAFGHKSHGQGESVKGFGGGYGQSDRQTGLQDRHMGDGTRHGQNQGVKFGGGYGQGANRPEATHMQGVAGNWQSDVVKLSSIQYGSRQGQQAFGQDNYRGYEEC